MAVFKLFPTHDSFVYTEKPLANVGRDELLEIGGYNTSAGGQTARTLIKWNTADIKNAINKVTASAGDSNFEVHLMMNLAMANELPIDISLEAFPLSSSWDEGTGKFGDSPDNISGCSWRFKNAGKTNQWATASYATNVTASFQTSNKGGGVWYTNYSATEDFSAQNNFDIETNITSIFSKYYDETLDNNGIILKLPDTFGEEYSRKENPANGLLEFNGNGGGMFSYNQCKMHTKVGDLLIFPYDLRHGVYPFNSTTECRRTLSYNCDLTKLSQSPI